MSHAALPMTDRDISVSPTVLVGLLGTFRLSVNGIHVAVTSNSKTEQMLVCLAMRRHRRIARGDLIENVWPDTDPSLASQSLNSTTHHLNKTILRHGGSGALVACDSGYYRLSERADVAVDLDLFDRYRARGMSALADKDTRTAVEACQRAMDLYRGDLCYGSRVDGLNERERLRVGFLDLMGAMAEHEYARDNVMEALGYLNRLLDLDFLREDAQRLAMRCHVRLGRRAQALRQYRLCCAALAEEFEATPEPGTVALFEQIRSNPAGI